MYRYIINSLLTLSIVFSMYSVQSQWLPTQKINGAVDINKLAVAGRKIIAVTAQNEYYYSLDKAKTWKKMNFDKQCIDIKAKDSLIIVSSKFYVYISKDFGTHFSESKVSEQNNIGCIYIDNNKIYVAETNISSSGFSNLYVTEDYGKTWTIVLSALLFPDVTYFHISDILVKNDTIYLGQQGNNHYPMYLYLIKENLLIGTSAVSTADNTTSILSYGNKIIAGSTKGFSISADNGKTWSKDSTDYGIINLYHFKNKLYATNYGTIYNYIVKNHLYYYSEQDKNFIDFNLSGMKLDINCLAAIDNTIILGTRGNSIVVSDDNGRNWRYGNLNLNYTSIRQIKSNNIYLFASTYRNGIMISEDGGKNWKESNEGLKLNNNIYLNMYADDTTMYLFSSENLIYCFDNNAKIWKYIAESPSKDYSYNISNIAVKGSLFFANCNDSLYTFDKLSNKWTLIMSDKRAISKNFFINPPYLFIYADLYNNSLVLISADTGKTWQNIGKENGLDATSIFCMKYNQGIYYAGTNKGLYWSEDNANTWKTEGSFYSITDIDFYRNYIFALYINYSQSNYSEGIYYSDNKFRNVNILPNILFPSNFNTPNDFKSFIISNDTIIAGNYNNGIWLRHLDSLKKLAVSIRVDGSNRICNGDSTKLIVNERNYKQYQWINFNGNVKSTDTVCYAKNTGNYRVYATDSFGNSAYSNIINIYNRTPAKAHIAFKGNDMLCSNDPIVLYADTLSQKLPLQWQKSGVNIDGATSSTYKTNITGIYNLTLTDTCNQIKSNTVKVSKDTIYNVNISTENKFIYCDKDSVLLVATHNKVTNPKNTEDFETGDLKQFKVLNSLFGQWRIDTSNVYEGKYSALVDLEEAFAIADLTTTMTYDKDDTVSFYFYLNMRYGGGFTFTIFHNSQYSYKASYNTNGIWQKISVAVKAGVNTFRWRQEFGEHPSYELAWIDNIVFKQNTVRKYQWFKEGEKIENATSERYYAKTAGNYNVIVSNDCYSVSSASISLQKPSALDTSLTVVYDTINKCRKGAASIKAVKANYIYQWQRDGKNINNANTVKSEYYADTSGAYRVIISDTNKCKFASDRKIINIERKINPEYKYNGNYLVCKDSVKTLFAAKDTNCVYQWNIDGNDITGATNFKYDVTATGFYQLKMMNNTGCNETSGAKFFRIRPEKISINDYHNSDPYYICDSSYYTLLSTDTLMYFDFEGKGYDMNNYSDYGDSDKPCYLTNEEAYRGKYSVKSGTVNGGSSGFILFPYKLFKYDSLTFYYKTKQSNWSELTFKFICNGNAIILERNDNWTKMKVPLISSNYFLWWGVSGTSLEDSDGLYLDNIYDDRFGNSTLQWQKDGEDIEAANFTMHYANEVGSYRLKISNDCGTIYSKLQQLLKSPFYTKLQVIDDTTDLCLKGAKFLVAPFVNGASYHWQYNNVLSSNNTNIFQANKNGNYQLEVYSNYCDNNYSIDINNVEPAFISKILPSDSIVLCKGSTAWVSTDITDARSYQWYKEGKIISGATKDSLLLNIIDKNQYSVKLKLNNNCSLTSQFKVIPELIPSKPEILADKSSLCFADSVMLEKYDLFDIDGLNFQWQKDGIKIPGANSPVYVAKDGGKYTLHSSNDCGDSTSTEFIVTSKAKVTVSKLQDMNSCPALAMKLLVNSSDTLTYQWMKDGKDIKDETNSVLNINTTGDYAVRLASNNGCTDTLQAFNLNKITALNAHISITGTSNICPDESLSVVADYAEGLSYQWQKNGENLAGENKYSIILSDSGYYRVIISNEIACTDTSEVLHLNINPAPHINPLGYFKTCKNGTITLDAGSGYASYLWSTAEKTQMITIDSTGIGIGIKNITVTVSNNYGCKSTSSATVEFDDCIEINESGNKLIVRYYPNPANALLNIVINSTNNISEAIKIDIIDNLGQTVYSELLNQKNTKLNLSKLSKGLYLLRLSNANLNFTGKIVLQ